MFLKKEHKDKANASSKNDTEFYSDWPRFCKQKEKITTSIQKKTYNCLCISITHEMFMNKSLRVLLPISIVVLLVVAATQSCTKDKGFKETANPQDNIIDSSRLVNVQYHKDIVPILTTYCYGTGNQKCHVSNSNQGGAHDFTSYQNLKDDVDDGQVESRVFTEGGGMPPTYSTGPKKLTATDLAVFKKWVNDGALEN